MKYHYLTSTHSEGTRHKAIGDGTVAVMDPDDVVEIECQGEGCRFCEMDAADEAPLDLDLSTEEVTVQDMASRKASQLKGVKMPTYKSLSTNNPDPENAPAQADDIDNMLQELSK